MAGLLLKRLFRAQKGITIGGGTTIKKANVKTGVFVFGTVSTVSAKEASLADADVAAGDIVLASAPGIGSAPDLLDDAIFLGARAVGGSVVAKIYNPTGGNLVQGSVTLTYLHLDVS